MGPKLQLDTRQTNIKPPRQSHSNHQLQAVSFNSKPSLQGKLEDFIKVQNCLLIHDYLHNTLPLCFQDYYFKKNTRQIQTRNSNIGCLFVPSQNTTTYGLNSISQQAIFNWNDSTKTHKKDLGEFSRYKLKSLLTNSMINN